MKTLLLLMLCLGTRLRPAHGDPVGAVPSVTPGACAAWLTLSSDARERLKAPNSNGAVGAPRALDPLAPGLSPEAIEADLRAGARVLFDTHPDNPSRGYAVFAAPGAAVPTAMNEIGRAREETFRLVGEGSGKSIDLDSYDPYYLQLICWDKKERLITGGYRLGRSDQILKRYGIGGLYLNQFFAIDSRLLAKISAGALEVGRSFVRPAYQKGLTLSLLWHGIGQVLVEHPHYRYLIGPVSISGEFHDHSRQLISEYLLDRHGHPRARHVRGRTPPTYAAALRDEDRAEALTIIKSLHDLRDVVREIEGDPSLKLPTMIKAYLDIDAKFLAFNWDEDFHALDGLIWTDLRTLPLSVVQRYMGKDAAAAYLHARLTDAVD